MGQISLESPTAVNPEVALRKYDDRGVMKSTFSCRAVSGARVLKIVAKVRRRIVVTVPYSLRTRALGAV